MACRPRRPGVCFAAMRRKFEERAGKCISSAGTRALAGRASLSGERERRL